MTECHLDFQRSIIASVAATHFHGEPSASSYEQLLPPGVWHSKQVELRLPALTSAD